MAGTGLDRRLSPVPLCLSTAKRAPGLGVRASGILLRCFLPPEEADHRSPALKTWITVVMPKSLPTPGQANACPYRKAA